jgi:hypothetical protein
MVEACRGAMQSGRLSPETVLEGVVRLVIDVTGTRLEGDQEK